MKFKNAISQLFKDSLIYGITGGLSKFGNLLIIPIIVEALSKEEYGIYDLTIVFSSIFTGIVVLGQDSAIARFYYDRKEDDDYRNTIVSIGFFIQVILTVFFFLFFLLFGDFIGSLIYPSSNQLIFFWKIALFVIPGQVFYLFSINLFKWTFSRNKYILMTVGNLVTTLGSVYLFLKVFKMGILGAILSLIIAANVFAIVGIILNRKKLKFTVFKRKELYAWKQMTRYGLPFTVIMMAGMLIPTIDRFFLQKEVSYELIAEYSIGVKMGAVMAAIVSAFSIAFGPYAYSNWHSDLATGIFSKVYKLYIIGLCYILMIYTFFGDGLIAIIANDSYTQSLNVYPLIAASWICTGVMEFTMLGIYWSKNTTYNLFVYSSGLIILIISNLLLVPTYLLIGAALSVLIAKASMCIISAQISKKYYALEFESSVIIFTGISFGLALASKFYNVPMFVKLIILIVFPILAFKLLFDHAQQLSIKKTFIGYLNR